MNYVCHVCTNYLFYMSCVHAPSVNCPQSTPNYCTTATSISAQSNEYPHKIPQSRSTLVSNRHLPPGHSRFLCFTANVKSWERGTICVLLFRIRYNWYCYWKVSNKWIHDKFLVLVSYPTSMSILDIQDHRSYTIKYDIFHHRR